MRNDMRPDALPAKSGYQRDLPHVQFSGRTLYITFATKHRWTLPSAARSLALQHVLHDDGIMYDLHAAVVMTDHVHMLLTPRMDERGELYGTAQTMNRVKGASAHSINRLLGRRGPVWQSEYFDRMIRDEADGRGALEYICANPVEAG